MALAEIRAGMGGPPGGPVRNSKPSRRSVRGQEVLPEDQETFAKVREGSWSPSRGPVGSAGPPGGASGVWRPSQKFGRGSEAFQEV